MFLGFGMIDGKEKGWIEFIKLFCIEKFTKIKKRLDQTKVICKKDRKYYALKYI